MSGRPTSKPCGQLKPRLAAATLLATLWAAGPVWSQSPAAPTAPAPDTTGATENVTPSAFATAPQPAVPDNGLLQTSCTACGGGLPPPGAMDCNGRCDTGCVPGRKGCDCNWNPETCVGRFFCGLYECLCCPDPCYDPPRWLGVADSAFFLDAARPITQMRIRVDSAWEFKDPDRAEYFFAREMTPQTQQIATCRGPNLPGKGPSCISKTIDYQELTMYNEASTGRIGAFVELPYRDVDFNNPGAVNQAVCCSQSQFADMNVGTKTLLLDCELLQLSFQFKTFIPIGSAGKGMGTSHVSLEPALLFNVKLSSDTYLQGELAYWIPIGGDPIYEANIWHNHFSLNHILWCPCKDLQLIGTAELNEWTIFGGAYTIPDYTLNGNFLATSASTSMLSGGPGIRGILCEKYDVGVGSLFAFTGSRWAKEMVRAEFRWRF